MFILPVLDLLGGQVVRGVGGRRHEYRPIESTLCSGSRPSTVARALVEQFGFDRAYVADLDAIAGAATAGETYREIAAQGLDLLVDAGISDAQHAARLANIVLSNSTGGFAGVIAGLESLPSPAALLEMLNAIGPRALVFSLDLKHGTPLAKGPEWSGADAWRIAARALELGVRRMIVLDLAQVGTGEGVGTLALCRRLRQADATLELISGGGVRGTDDLRRLEDSGCDAALVASALHDGRLSPDDTRHWTSRP